MRSLRWLISLFRPDYLYAKGKSLDRIADMYGMKRQLFFFKLFKESDRKFRKRVRRRVMDVVLP